MKLKTVLSYLETKLKIKPLGEVTLEEEYVNPETVIGYRVLIDKVDTGIVIWWADYAVFLEEQLEYLEDQKLHRVKNK